MYKRKTTGLRLKEQTKSQTLSQSIFDTFNTCLLCAAMCLCADAFIGGVNLAACLATCLILCLAYGAFERFLSKEMYFLGVLLLLFLLALTFGKELKEGIRLLWNGASISKLLGKGIMLKPVETVLGAKEQAFCTGLISAVLGAVLCLLLCIIKQKAHLVAALLPVAMLLCGLICFGITPPAYCFIFAIGSAILSLTGEKRGSAGGYCMGACAILICALMLMLPFAQNIAEIVGKRAEKALHDYLYHTKYTALIEGDFSAYIKKEKVQKPALSVTMSIPQKMYLRGFSGAVLEGDCWHGIEGDTLKDNKDLLYWLNTTAFNPQAQFYAALGSTGRDFKLNDVQIINTGACSKYNYVPFSITSTGSFKGEDLRLDGVDANGERSLYYTALSGGYEAVEQVIDALKNGTDAEIKAYRQAESEYRAFVYENYIDVPGEIQAWLDADFPYEGNDIDVADRQIRAIDIIAKCFPKDGTQREVELPFSAMNGTDYQYAAVAVMALRHCKIPSRYAEGYLISEEMANAAGDEGNITVTSADATAWAEIYQDGIGWLPMELTPGFYDVIEQDEVGSGTNGTKIKEGKEYEPPLEQKETEEQNEGGEKAKLEKPILFWLIGILSFLILLLSAVLIRRHIIIKAREKRYDVPNDNEAAAWMFGDAAALLEKMGFDRGKGSMRALYEPIKKRVGGELALAFIDAADVNDMAMFSSMPVGKEGREKMRCFVEKTKACLKTNTKWHKKLLIKWILCLY